MYSSQQARRLFNFAIRGVSLASKFALLFALAKFLEPVDLGLYGLLAATISYTIYALGFDFYTYSTRELIVSDRNQWSALLRDQAAFFGIVYSFVLPMCLLVFWFGFLPWALAAWFAPLLVLEHIGQELNRLLVAMSEPLWANLVLFFRTGAWAIVVVILMWIQPELRALVTALAGWVAGSLVACLVAVSRLRQLDCRALSRPIDWGWVKRGVRVAVPLLVATLAARGLYTFDRYLMEGIGGLEALGAYVFFVGISNSIAGFLDAGVFTFLYPALILAADKQDKIAYQLGMRRLAIQTLSVTGVLALSVIVFAHPLVDWLQRPVYEQHFGLLYWTVISAVIFAAGMIPHYGLYSLRLDVPIIISHIAGLVVFFVAVSLLRHPMAENAVPAAVAIAFLLILIVKSYAFRRSRFLVKNQ